MSPLAVALAVALAALMATWAPDLTAMKNKLVDQVHRLLAAGRTAGLDDLDLDPSTLAADLLHSMGTAAADAAARVVEEARDQGVDLHPAHIPAGQMQDDARAAAEQVTIRLRTVAARAVADAPEDASLDDKVGAVRSALDGYGDAGPSQLAGNAMHGAMTTGRLETYRQGPVGAIYASEKNDNRTCPPCHEVDGRWLGNTDDMAQIQLSYPGGALGGYVYCQGGYNCRGTIVGVWRRGTGDEPPVPAAPPEEPPAPTPEPERAPAPAPEPGRHEPEPTPEPAGPLIREPTSETGRSTRRGWRADQEFELRGLLGRDATAEKIAGAKSALAAELKADFAGKKVAVRVSEGGLSRRLAAGRFKTLFETGASHGSDDIALRAAVEDAMFGLPADLDPTLRPVYGYLEMDDIRGRGGLVGAYGNVRVILKDSVRARTTATVGDSLGQSILPSPVDDPSWESANAGLRARLGEPGGLRRIDYAEHQGDLYVEAQIHGGVGLDDIERVLLEDPPDDVLRKALDESGVPWEVRDQPSPAKPGPSAPDTSSGAGDDGPGIEVRPLLAQANTTDEIEDALIAEAERITGRYIHVLMSGQSPDTAREHAEGILRGLERFPRTRLTLVGRRDLKHYAEVDQPSRDSIRMFFSTDWTSPDERRFYLAALRRDAMHGFHPVGTGTPVAIALHEFGHVLDFSVGGSVQSRVFGLISQIAADSGQPLRSVVSGRVSRYARENTRELIAEAFADVMINGDEASDLSQQIFDILVDAYNAKFGGG